jgi:hypothetical protein
LNTVPADQEPTIRQTNTVHVAWDVMVGLGELLFLRQDRSARSKLDHRAPRALSYPRCRRHEDRRDDRRL